MPCFVMAVIALAFSRVVLVLMLLFSDYLERAYHGYMLPFVGFVFLPVTTILYAWMVNNNEPIAGVNLILLVAAVLIDAGSWGGGGYSRRR
jgi:hypothetical protein